MRQTRFPRRAVLALPLLLLPRLAAGGQDAIPPFPAWVGRTALLSGDGGAARLLLAPDGTGRMAVKLLLFCRGLPIHAWDLAPDGMSLRYARASALDAARRVEGEARILPGEGLLVWVEARTHLARLEGFLEPEAAARCG